MSLRRQLCVALLFIFVNQHSILFAAPPPAPEPPKTVVVLIDRSGSVRTAEMRRLYLGSLKTIMSSLNPGDAFIIAWITDRSAEELELPVNEKFRFLVVKTHNKLLADADREKQINDFKKDVEKIYDTFPTLFDAEGQRKIDQTRILDSIQLAKRVFESYPADKQILVLMSDMVEESSDGNFRRDSLRKEKTSQIISSLRSSNRLPDLSGVKVYVIGASYPDMNQYNRIRSFWLAFFRATGGQLRDRDYGSALINFEA